MTKHTIRPKKKNGHTQSHTIFSLTAISLQLLGRLAFRQAQHIMLLTLLVGGVCDRAQTLFNERLECLFTPLLHVLFG